MSDEIGPPTNPPPTPQSGPAAGWYPDPDGQGSVRYWDGSSWTDNRAPDGSVGNQKTNGMAIASMVLGILWLYWIGSVLALVFGYVAKNQIENSRGTQSGRGMAIAGIVLGWVGVGVAAVIFLIALGASGS